MLRWCVYFLITMSTILENTIMIEKNISKAMMLVDNLSNKKDHLFSFILQKYYTSDLINELREDSVLDLILSGDYGKMILTNYVLTTNDVYSDHKKTATFLLLEGKKCYKKYLQNPYSFKPKIYYKNKKKQYNSLLMMVKSGDKSCITEYFKLLATKQLFLEDQVPLLKHLASKNVGMAFGYLGEAYFYGVGVKKDTERALNYFLKGKELSKDIISCNGIGKILMTDEYKHYMSAKEHFDMLDGLSMNESDYHMSILYRDHFKVPQFAGYYLSRAVAMGYLPAIFLEGEDYYNKGDYESAIIRLQAVIEYYEIITEFEDLAYEKFKAQDYESCLFLLLITIEMGSSSSLENALFLLDFKSYFSTKKFSACYDKILFKLYYKRSNYNYKDLNCTGNLYFFGNGVLQSYTAAFSYYLISASLKEPEGLLNLSYMYEYGLGTQKDLVKAAVLLRKMIYTDDTYLLVFYSFILFIVRQLVNLYTLITVFTIGVGYKIYCKK